MHSASPPGIGSGGGVLAARQDPDGADGDTDPVAAALRLVDDEMAHDAPPRPRRASVTIDRVYTRTATGEATLRGGTRHRQPAARRIRALTAAGLAPTIRGTHARELDEHPLQVDPPAARRAARGAPPSQKPGSLLHPQFWAEDGTLFFQEAFNHGFLDDHPAAGLRLPALVPQARGRALAALPDGAGPPDFQPGRLRGPAPPGALSAQPPHGPHHPLVSRAGCRGAAVHRAPGILRNPREPHQLPLAPGLDGALHPGGDAGRGSAGPGARNVHGGSVFPDRTLFNPVSAARRTAPARGREGRAANPQPDWCPWSSRRAR